MPSSWVAWMLGGAALLMCIGGVALTVWALFWDRSRGRRRCPRCWQDLAGVPGLRCPECGKLARAERELHRTKRRLRWAVCGVVMAVFIAPAVQGCQRLNEGVRGFVPTTVLIGLVRWGGASGGGEDYMWGASMSSSDSGASVWAARVLVQRCNADGMPAWQRWLAACAVHRRTQESLDLDPPRAFADHYQLFVQSTMGRWDADKDLVTVKLRGPKVAVVGMPLCVEVEGFGFSGDIHKVVLDAGLQADAIPVRLYTAATKMHISLISDPGLTPTVMANLGSPTAAADGVWVTAKIWKWESGVPAAPPDVVRRVWLATPIVATGEHQLGARTLSESPFSTDESSLSESWGLSTSVYDHGTWELTMPMISSRVPKDLAVGVRVEILKGERVVLTGRACFARGDVFVAYPWGLVGDGNFRRWARIQLDRVAGSEAELVSEGPYTARVTGDEQMAWWHLDAKSYWEGQIVVPLTVQNMR